MYKTKQMSYNTKKHMQLYKRISLNKKEISQKRKNIRTVSNDSLTEVS